MYFKLYNTIENQQLKLAPLTVFIEEYKYIKDLRPDFSLETVDLCYDVTIDESYYWFPVLDANQMIQRSILSQMDVEYTFEIHKITGWRIVFYKTAKGETSRVGEIPRPFQKLLPEKGVLQFNGNTEIPYFYFYWSQNND